MPKKRKWSDKQLEEAVKNSTSIRQVIKKLGLIPAGGNYSQVSFYINENKLSIVHFKGKGWNKGMRGIGKPIIATKDILKTGTRFQSYKLKKRLFEEGLKEKMCEECGWAKKAKDGRLPLELHHKNGVSTDNRIINLEVLCPNCHSLKDNYRGRNKKRG